MSSTKKSFWNITNTVQLQGAKDINEDKGLKKNACLLYWKVFWFLPGSFDDDV
jgi:hypothetical protein